MHKAEEITGKGSAEHVCFFFIRGQEFHDLVEVTNSTGPGICNSWCLLCVAAAANIPR